jgi:hypothetical protein
MPPAARRPAPGHAWACTLARWHVATARPRGRSTPAALPCAEQHGVQPRLSGNEHHAVIGSGAVPSVLDGRERQGFHIDDDLSRRNLLKQAIVRSRCLGR